MSAESRSWRYMKSLFDPERLTQKPDNGDVSIFPFCQLLVAVTEKSAHPITQQRLNAIRDLQKLKPDTIVRWSGDLMDLKGTAIVGDGLVLLLQKPAILWDKGKILMSCKFVGEKKCLFDGNGLKRCQQMHGNKSTLIPLKRVLILF